MKVRVTRLEFWKTEHNQANCEDASEAQPARGLFAVADGVGTASFSDIWSKILVSGYCLHPLCGNDEFELEWWLRNLVPEYTQKAPDPKDLGPIYRDKARLGSQSTLLGLRITKAEDGAAEAELIASGDTCGFLADSGSEQVSWFPLEKCSDFDQHPVCLPTRLVVFDRAFQKPKIATWNLRPGARVILTTDAVSKWIVCSGAPRFATMRKRFDQIANVKPSEWSVFIEECRARNEMIDDDCHALVIHFLENAEDAEKLEEYKPDPGQYKARKERYQEYVRAGDREMTAIAYGDGKALESVSVRRPIDLEESRKVADAIRSIMIAVSASLASGQDAKRKVNPMWQRFRALLEKDTSPNALTLLNTLTSLGVIEPPSEIPGPVSGKSEDQMHAETAAAKLRAVLKDGDDEQIARQADFVRERLWLIVNGLLTEDERKRVEEARKRVSALAMIREALAREDEKALLDAVFRISPAISGEYPKLTDNERKMIERASKSIAMAAQVRLAIEADDDQQIVASYDSNLMQAVFTSPETERIHTAEARMRALQHFREALATKDDEQILLAYNAILDNYPKVTAAERQQLEEARKRWAAWNKLATALKSKDEREIVKAYDPILAKYPRIQAAEWAALEQAQRCVEMADSLGAALASGDDDQVARAYNPEFERPFTFLGLPDGSKERVIQISKSAEVEGEFHEAFEQSDDSRMVALLESPNLRKEKLSGAEIEHAEAVRPRVNALDALRQAIGKDDDELIVQCWSANQDRLLGYSQVQESHRERVELAQRRSIALMKFRDSLQTGDDEEIVKRYDPLLDNYPLIAKTERERLALARKRIETVRPLKEAIAHNHSLDIVSSADPVLIGYDKLSRREVLAIWSAFERVGRLWAWMDALVDKDLKQATRLYRPELEELFQQEMNCGSLEGLTERRAEIEQALAIARQAYRHKRTGWRKLKWWDRDSAERAS